MKFTSKSAGEMFTILASGNSHYSGRHIPR